MADRTLILRCQDTCSILAFDAWDVGDPETHWFVEVYKRPGKHWRWRLRVAIGLIFGKDPVIDDLCLDPGEIVRLRDFFNECYPEVAA